MRKSIRHFFNRPRQQQVLFFKALLWLAVIKLGVVVLPFKLTHRLAAAQVPDETRAFGDHSSEIDQVVWAIEAARHYVPRATCLPQALATQVMLGRRGYITQLHIGFLRDKDGTLQGHAWIERHGKILIGDIGVSSYTLLNALEQPR